MACSAVLRRGGWFDPGLIDYLVQQHGMPIADVMHMLTKRSGLLGISGISHDMRELNRAVAQNNPRAALALSCYCYQLSKCIASYLPALQYIDCLVFTGGIGENNPGIRQEVGDLVRNQNFASWEK